MKRIIQVSFICALTTLLIACEPSKPKQQDLPEQPDRWVSTIQLDSDSKAKFIEKTRDYLVTTVSQVKELDGIKTLRVGDVIEGLRIGAIKCSFHWKDASYGGKQYMWRGRWACMAGNTQHEVMNAVGNDGEKLYSYIHVSPVTLSKGY